MTTTQGEQMKQLWQLHKLSLYESISTPGLSYSHQKDLRSPLPPPPKASLPGDAHSPAVRLLGCLAIQQHLTHSFWRRGRKVI
jgi:hypothetical protein